MVSLLSLTLFLNLRPILRANGLWLTWEVLCVQLRSLVVAGFGL